MLSDFADVSLGYKLTADQHRLASGDGWRVLQTRDLDDDGNVNWRLVTSVNDSDRKMEPCQVTPGDVLFAPRSPRLGALLLGTDVANPRTAASSHFYIIRVDGERLAADYLVWYLNHPRTRDVLEAENRGTHLPFVPMEAIRRLDITLPPIERQRHIGAIDRLVRHERQLTAALSTLHEERLAAETWRAAHSS